MPVVMWDRLKITAPDVDPAEGSLQQHHKPLPFRPQQQQQQLDDVGDKPNWQDSYDNRINALGISNGLYKYAVRVGRTVPPIASGQLVPPTDSDDITAPPVQPPPPRNPRRRPPPEAEWRPASSIYIDDESASPMALLSSPPAADMYRQPTTMEISPPSSPDIDAVRNVALPGNVSPLDDDADVSQQELVRSTRPHAPPQQQQPRTGIPTMRRERRKNQDAAAAALRESKSRDRLRDKKNHPVQHPSAAWDSAGTDGPGRHAYGLTTTVTGPARTGSATSPSFGQRMRQFAKGKAEPLASRPPWNGASGRTTLVDPVRDDPNVGPLPRRSSKREARSGGRTISSPLSPASSSDPETSSTVAGTVRCLLPSRSNQKLGDAAKPDPRTDLTAQTSVAQSYPSPPQFESPIPSSHAPSQPTRPANAPSLLLPKGMPDPQKAIKRKPSPSTHASLIHAQKPHSSVASSGFSAQTEQQRNLPEKPPPLAIGSLTSPNDPWVQPPSRFSVTTCNTTIPGSPRHSPDEDYPPIPTPPEPQSMMNRRRPIPGDRSVSNDPIVISVKSPAVQSSHGGRDFSGRPSSSRSIDKALPPAPPELQSVNDRVAHLNARLDSLTHRKTNINKSIKQMTELMPTDNLLASAAVLHKRELEKQKVEGLREELAEIQREEYDLGLKLHRAYKRLEKTADFEPTTLWVRRVTD